jgi:trigger factor
MNIQEEKKTDQQFDLQVELSHQDIKNHFNAEVNKMSRTMKMKGFRPGKTPPALLKKMYGPDVMARSINELIQSKTQSYLEDNSLEVFGPLVITDVKKDFQFSPDVNEDFNATLRFLKPFNAEQGLEGLKGEISYYLPLIEEDKMEAHINEILLDNGTLEEANEIKADSLVEIDILRENETDEPIIFKLVVSQIPDEKLRESIMNQAVGFEFEFKPKDISDNEQFIFVNILDKLNSKMDAENVTEVSTDDTPAQFTADRLLKGKISKIEDRVPAVLDEELFKKIDPRGEVDTKEKLEEVIKKGTQNRVRPESNILFFMELKEMLTGKYPLDADDDYVREVYVQNYQVDQHALDHHLSELREDLSWMRIKDGLDKEFGLRIQEHELRNAIGRDIFQYFGGYNISQQMLDDLIDRQLKNKEQVNHYSERIYFAKVAEALVENNFFESKEISTDELNQRITDMNTKIDEKYAANDHHHHHHHDEDVHTSEVE